ncbi:MAG: UDP-N-acetylmuramoyl-L-alanine--D-glutamate ligase [Acutalibacteraceae bacterium]|jgi:UDP-N-acetylmuramoylalanine--D-glutamate ligase
MPYGELIEYFKNKKVLMLGFGREGRSTYRLLRRFYPDMPLGIADLNEIEAPDKITAIHTGEKYLAAMENYELIMKSPGISMRGIKIPPVVEITCQTDLFLRYAPCIKVGITGTKGKTTTSTLIFETLMAGGKPAVLIGNIGIPVFDSLDNIEGRIAVIEMSSHQLEFCKASPHVAVFTNLYEEHLDHYDSFAAYASAKLNIARFQSEKDFFIYGDELDENELLDFGPLKGTRIPIRAEEAKGQVFEAAKLNDRLLGKHNRLNIMFTAAAAGCMGVGEAALIKAVTDFKGIEHRMEPVGTFKGIKFFNDSIATIPQAVPVVVEALGDADTLILGGMDRGIDYTDLITYLQSGAVKTLVCLPETGYAIGNALQKTSSKAAVVYAKDMEEAVRHAYKLTAAGQSCVLCPAAASYNVYKNFEQRGNHYKELVRALGNND